jgi:5-oxoprolinase (ATP-hydrolysing)
MAKPFPRLSFAIDRGGTFTDIVATVWHDSERAEFVTEKLLSVCPDYEDAPSEGIWRVLDRVLRGAGIPAPVGGKGSLIPTLHIEQIRMGTTIATNALLERKGVQSALVVTKGFGDILLIGNQARPNIFALDIQKPSPLYSSAVEATERVRVIGESKEKCESLSLARFSKPNSSVPTVQGVGGEECELIVPLDRESLRTALEEVHANGIRSLAISFLHGHTFHSHEVAAAELARSIGFTNVSVAHQLMPAIKYVPRTTTTCVDAYLTPLLKDYITRFKSKFDAIDNVRVLFMQSDGGLAKAETFFGFRAVLSGPAGGVVGIGKVVTEEFGDPKIPLIGFDMGGTSTDVSRCEGSQIEHISEAEIAGVTLQAPQLDIHTVAAGGGSILQWVNGMFKVGPESAGALPGPACYGRGGQATVTDANVVLGRLVPANFPSVFGASGKEQLSVEAARVEFEKLRQTILLDTGKGYTIEEIASSFLSVANESMSRPIRTLTEAKGHRPVDHVLAVFGGAGGQHACAVAEKLGITKIIVPRFASVLSALGIACADVVVDNQRPSNIAIPNSGDTSATRESLLQQILSQIQPIVAAAVEQLRSQGFTEETIQLQRLLHLRFEGSNTLLTVSMEAEEGVGSLSTSTCSLETVLERFTRAYQKQFGFVMKKNRNVKVEVCRVRAIGVASAPLRLAATIQDPQTGTEMEQPQSVRVYFHQIGWTTCPMYNAAACVGKELQGPALIVLQGSTIVLEPGCKGSISKFGNVIIETSAPKPAYSAELDPLSLSIFSHRFMGIAEQMGVALQRTALSTNIKERLDFSCGLFDADAGLVANAPHIPVHLGAMGRAIAFQKSLLGDNWKEGDVIVTNDPAAGGSHLPDITVMTPCWFNGRVIFYVASRGHHSDIGGSTPGSMPPFSKRLEEEGAIIRSFKLVENGVFQEEGITELLMSPAKLPGLSGCRALEDVLSDLKAQVAANQRGVELVKALIDQVGLEVVEAYMLHIQNASERNVRTLLKGLSAKYGSQLEASDAMDDGTVISVRIQINPDQGSAVFDWTSTGSQVVGSTNCPTAVVRSAILYCLRCLIGRDIPLNEGTMRPIQVITRPGSILAPKPSLPVVGGNVLTSQRVTDVILLAVRAMACSQGDMNNFTYGNDKFAYYETICGGSGAGDGFHGASAVQTHMTNTRITDPEILEARYPVLLTRFAVRRGSGGRGLWNGGDGVVRQVMFLAPLTVVFLSERRALRPAGLNGGSPGCSGINMWYPSSASREVSTITSSFLWDVAVEAGVNVGAKNTISVSPFDIVTISTPGGGGFGQGEK